MPSKNIYTHYVYAYLREDGSPYYIGMGCGYRATMTHRRAKGKRVSIPPKYRIVYLARNLSKIGAAALERRYIRWYGRKNIDDGGILINIHEGGDGGSYPGWKHKKSTKEKISNSLKGHKVSDETRKKISDTLKGKSTTGRPKLIRN